MLQSCGNSANVGTQAWKGEKRFSSFLLLPKGGTWEQSDVLVVTGLVIVSKVTPS